MSRVVSHFLLKLTFATTHANTAVELTKFVGIIGSYLERLLKHVGYIIRSLPMNDYERTRTVLMALCTNTYSCPLFSCKEGFVLIVCT